MPARIQTRHLRSLLVLLAALLMVLAVGCSDSSSTSADGGYYGPGGEQSNGGNSNPNQPGGGNTNVSLGGAQDFGYFRRLLDDGIVPTVAELDAAGFFAEHHTVLPEPTCGNRVCVQTMLGVMGNLLNGANCTMLQIGLNSPMTIDPDDPSQRPPLRLGVVVDVSGSMGADGKMDFVRRGLTRMVNELSDTDEISIVTYSTRARVIFDTAPVGAHRNDLLDIIDDLRPEGSTNIYDGLEMGYQTLLEGYDGAAQNRLILLSDGVATAGNTVDEAITSMSRAFNSDGIGLTTVGLGTDFNLSLMRGLAEQSDGNFYFLEDSSAVDEVFTQELSYFTLPVAFDVTIEVEQGAHYEFGQATGSSMWQDTETGGSLSVPSVFLAHRVSDNDVEPGGERRGGGSALLLELMPRDDVEAGVARGEVATVRFSYREPGTNALVEDSVVVEYPHAPTTLLTQGFFDNEIVTKSFVMLNIYAAMRDATMLWHGGMREDAIALLRRVIAAAEDYNGGPDGGANDVDIELDIELMEQLIEVMVAAGTPEPVEIDIPENPWPAD